MVTDAHDPERAAAELLLSCEDRGLAPEYFVQDDTYKEAKNPFFGQTLPVRTEPVSYRADGREIFVVSDLHIASGRNHAGVYKGTENFFADDSFFRFLEHARASKKTENALLIINGDIFDFLRVTDYPGKIRKVRFFKSMKRALKFNPVGGPKPAMNSGAGQECAERAKREQYDEWSRELGKIGMAKTPRELEAGVSDREKRYGLGTNDFKTIYKLIRIKHGHPQFFHALALWLEQGHKVMILKGNHDLELYWLNVRNYLRLILAEDIAGRNPGSSVVDVLQDVILPNITFIDDSVLIDGDFYVEHGHRYDKFTMVLDSPVLQGNPAQINLPFGSFINRYLINRIELFYPFLDNVRPTGNVLPMLLKENFPLGLKVLTQHTWLLLRILVMGNFRYLWFMFHKVAWITLALLCPLILVVALFGLSPVQAVGSFFQAPTTGGFRSMVISQIQNFALIFLSYLLARFVVWFQLAEPNSLDTYARIRFEGTDYRIMTMGHTHNPGDYLFQNSEQNDEKCKEQRFYNTGTWIPVIEISTAEVREDKTYTFLHLERDQHGKLQPAAGGLLQRWNDDAQRADLQVLIERK